METVLEERLQAIQWPRETAVSFEISEDGKTVALDVDLPEFEDLPTRTATMPARGWRVTIKDMSESKLRQLYMRHVHGIAFRVIGETFAALPTVEQVILSGYSQRPDKATGQTRDEYLYSVKVSRGDWSKIDFGNLAALDVTESLAQFELRRDTTKSGTFRSIEPFGQV